MQPNDKIKLFLVDDDALFLKMLEVEFLDTADFVIETYASGELCIENLDKNPDLIILDYHLDGIDANAMNALETLDKIKEFDTTIPVVMLSAQDKIDVAIKCMHHKATDYVVKSETAFFRLKQIVSAVLHAQKVEKQLNWYMDRM